MIEEDYKILIINEIKLNAGTRPDKLALHVMSQVNPVKFDNNKYNDSLESLLESGDIQSLYYTIDKTRILYFPKGTTFEINAVKNGNHK